MNTQDMDRLVSEYHAYIQNAERCGADQAFKEAALNYQWAAEICSRLVERTTGAEAQEWLKKLAACEKKTRKLWTELYTRVRKSEPDTGSADDSACGTQTTAPAARRRRNRARRLPNRKTQMPATGRGSAAITAMAWSRITPRPWSGSARPPSRAM